MRRLGAKFSRATADVVSTAIAINPVDKSLSVDIEPAFTLIELQR
jgi:hypothetical protein